MEESMSEMKKKKEKQQNNTHCCFMMDELLQIRGCVQNLRGGSNSLLTKIFEQFMSCYGESPFAS